MTKSELRKNIIQILQLAVQGNGLCERTPALKKSNVSNIAICALCPGEKDCAPGRRRGGAGGGQRAIGDYAGATQYRSGRRRDRVRG